MSAVTSIIIFYLLIKQIIKGGKSRREYQLVKNNPIFQDKIKALANKIPSVYTSWQFIFKVLVLTLLIGVSVLAYQTSKTSDTILKGFDPYELLGVDFNTPIPQIKKAYRY